MLKVAFCDINNIDFNSVDLTDFPKDRLDYINSFTNENRKNQSIAVWLLLKKTLFDLGLNSVYNRLSHKNGVWFDSKGEYFISLSHSKNIVFVAISSSFVGVDVQVVDDKILNIKRRFENIYNLQFDSDISESEKLTILWCAEESFFKANIKNGYSFYKKITNNGNNFILFLASKNYFDGSIENVNL